MLFFARKSIIEFAEPGEAAELGRERAGRLRVRLDLAPLVVVLEIHPPRAALVVDVVRADRAQVRTLFRVVVGVLEVRQLEERAVRIDLSVHDGQFVE
ncbi:MAG: hypothetical protein KJ042_18255, partial [Deltaproteobacteria bacterium]|nr:hypothetical protein [Deltaproteobacteria bacterium]